MEQTNRNAANKKNRPLNRLGFTGVAAIIVILVFLFFFGVEAIQASILRINMANINELAQHDITILNNRINARFESMAIVVEDIRLWTDDQGHRIPLDDLLPSEDLFVTNTTSVALVSNDGTVHFSTGLVETKDPTLAELCQSYDGKFVTRFVSQQSAPVDPTEEQLIYGVPIAPLTVEGVTYDYIICTVKASQLASELRTDSYSGQGFSSVIDLNGYYVASPDRSELGSGTDNFFNDIQDNSISNFSSVDALKAALTTTTTTTTATLLMNSQPVECYLVFTPMYDLGWYHVSVIPTSVFDTQSTGIVALTVVLLVAVLVSVALIVWFSLRQQKQRVELQDKAQVEELNRRLIQSKVLSDYFISTFVAAYYIDLKDHSQLIYRRPDALKKQLEGIDDYLAYIHKYIDEDIHPDDREMMYQAVDPSYIAQQMRAGKDYSLVCRDISFGQERYYEFRVIRGNDTDHVAFIFTDITSAIEEQQKLQSALEDALSLAQSASRAKTTFLNSMSHDIRTPMNAIIGYTGLAAAHIHDPEQVQDYLAKIAQSSDHLLSLINDVLDMSRIESGRMELEENAENLPEILHGLSDIVQANLRAKRQFFQPDFSGIKDPDVFCDKLRLSQILLNVLSNAIKYTPAGGIISLRVTETAYPKAGYGLYEFRVRDNGIGMSTDFLATIFDPFTRMQSSTVSGIQGTGLGMTITKQLVELMGGSIHIHSQEDEGTEVLIHFTFPLAAARPDFDEPIDQAPLICDFHGKKLLLVEDNEMNREIATEILEEAGFVVDTAENGMVAVDKMRHADPGDYDLILMDVQMPLMDGYEATRHIRALSDPAIAKIPIIAMTANAFEEDRQAAMRCGMNEHVVKPIDVHKLKAVLGKFLCAE